MRLEQLKRRNENSENIEYYLLKLPIQNQGIKPE